RVLILGGGFAGVSTAQELTKQLKRRGRLAGAPARGVRAAAGRALGSAVRTLTHGARANVAAPEQVEVVLVNRDNYFVLQPLLADIISGTIETTHVVVPLRRMLRGAQIELGHVEHIDLEAQRVDLRRRMDGRAFS